MNMHANALHDGETVDSSLARVDYQTDPSRYRHWRLDVAGAVATLAMNVAEDGGIRPGYKLKLNSYDLGVDIELYDALQRIRFEHPGVRAVVVTSLRERVFCSGANIFMLGLSSHAWKVNFCKFTNETRNGIEDSSRHSGIRFLAAVNGACAGGGYELALACDEILLVDDRSSSVSLPEVPLLGVLPGTGGLTRVTDKRHVRHDRADIFCTTTEGVRGQRAVDWRLVDAIAKPAQFDAAVAARAQALVAQCEAGGASGRCQGRYACTVATERSTTPAITANTSTLRSIVRGAWRRSPFAGPRCPRRTTSRPSKRRVRNGGRWRWRASWTMQSFRFAPMSSTSARGCLRPAATRRACSKSTRRSNATQRTGSSARPPACCAGRWRGSTCRRARCSR
jgi:enoyl-CoA hydratase/carnithine racemase